MNHARIIQFLRDIANDGHWEYGDGSSMTEDARAAADYLESPPIAEESVMDIKTALTYMQNLGVALNDDDSEALDTLCDFVDAAVNRKVAPSLPDPSRVMWRYGIETKYYTEDQMLDFARKFAACFST